MQTKTTLRYPYTSVKMTKIKKTDNSKCWCWGGVVAGTIHHFGSSVAEAVQIEHVHRLCE